MMNNMYKLYNRLYEERPQAYSSAPGRIDFLNTHQDYKGLPVVSVAVNLRTHILAGQRSDELVIAYSTNIGLDKPEKHRVGEQPRSRGKWWGDYVKAATRIMEETCGINRGLNLLVSSSIPIAAGMASSAALIVSIIAAINTLYDCRLSPREIARASYRAEHDILGIPCGVLDQYGSALGGIQYIETRPPYRTRKLYGLGGVFVVIDSGVKHSAREIHPRMQAELTEAHKQLLRYAPPDLRRLLGESYTDTRWDKLDLEQLEPLLSKIKDTAADRIRYTILAHKSTMKAIEIMEKSLEDPGSIEWMLGDLAEWYGYKPHPENRDEAIGVIMTYQHHLLSRLYHVSLSILDRIVMETLRLGAYGAKLSGAGLGGSIVAYTSGIREAYKIISHIRGMGALRGWIVSIDEGVVSRRIK